MGVGEVLFTMTFKMWECPHCGNRQITDYSHERVAPNYQGHSIENCFEKAERKPVPVVKR